MKSNLKLNSVVCLLLLCTLLCSTQLSAEAIAQSLQHYQQQSDDGLRLKCFDSLAEAVQGQQAEGSQNATLNVAKDKSDQQQQRQTSSINDLAKESSDPAANSTLSVAKYGLTEKKNEAEEDQTIAAKVLMVERDPFKKLIITLDIGHVWLQKETGFFKRAVGDEVYLQSSALGSYFLGKPGMNKSIRVKRLR